MAKVKLKLYKPNRIFKKIPDFKTFYVTGAIGGFRNPYDFRLTFYNEDTNSVILERQKISQNENLEQDEIDKNLLELEIPTICQCELVMTELAAKELHNFLGKELKALVQIRKEVEKSKEKSK